MEEVDLRSIHAQQTVGAKHITHKIRGKKAALGVTQLFVLIRSEIQSAAPFGAEWCCGG